MTAPSDPPLNHSEIEAHPETGVPDAVATGGLGAKSVAGLPDQSNVNRGTILLILGFHQWVSLLCLRIDFCNLLAIGFGKGSYSLRTEISLCSTVALVG